MAARADIRVAADRDHIPEAAIRVVVSRADPAIRVSPGISVRRFNAIPTPVDPVAPVRARADMGMDRVAATVGRTRVMHRVKPRRSTKKKFRKRSDRPRQNWLAPVAVGKV